MFWLWIVLALALLLGGQALIFRATKHLDDEFLTFFLSLIYWIILAIPAVLLTECAIAATGGAYMDYGKGVREGYVIEVCERGWIWKTCECKMLPCESDGRAQQEAFRFSIAKGPEWSDVVIAASSSMRKRVRLCYRTWGVMPYSVGSSGNQAIRIFPVE